MRCISGNCNELLNNLSTGLSSSQRRSISDLNQEISHQSESEDHQTYKIVIQNRILSPAMYSAMALLALSLSLGAVRKTGMGPRLAVGLFIGLSFKYLQDFLIPMTLVFNLPPLIVAIFPVFICASVAFSSSIATLDSFIASDSSATRSSPSLVCPRATKISS